MVGQKLYTVQKVTKHLTGTKGIFNGTLRVCSVCKLIVSS